MDSQNESTGSASIDDITRLCDDVVNEENVPFLVQFFGIDEITDSFSNSNLLVSQLFKDKIDSVVESKVITCYFLFHDVKAFVGYGNIVRKDEKVEGGQEPYEFEFNWVKLTMLPYNDIAVGADLVLDTIGDQGDMNWELKEISKEQSDAIAEAVSQGPAESLESIVLKYEHLIQQPATPAVLGVESSNDIDGDSKLGNEGDEVREKQAEGSHKRNRSSERSSSRNRSYPEVEEPKRSRIPFDVTKMSYDQYCAKHYSYAIEMYRAEKLAQYHQQQQAARAMSMGMGMGMGGGMGMGMPMHMMGPSGGVGIGGMYPGMGQGMGGQGHGLSQGYGQPVGGFNPMQQSHMGFNPMNVNMGMMGGAPAGPGGGMVGMGNPAGYYNTQQPPAGAPLGAQGYGAATQAPTTTAQ